MCDHPVERGLEGGQAEAGTQTEAQGDLNKSVGGRVGEKETVKIK